MSEEWADRFFHLCTLLGEVPTDVLARKAREMFPGLVDDPAQRAAFREQLRYVAMCRRQVPLTPEDAAETNMFRGPDAPGFVVKIDDDVVGVHDPAHPLIPERTVEDILSESAVELKAADAAEALAATFEEDA
jgi:hypothetical protein